MHQFSSFFPEFKEDTYQPVWRISSYHARQLFGRCDLLKSNQTKERSKHCFIVSCSVLSGKLSCLVGNRRLHPIRLWLKLLYIYIYMCLKSQNFQYFFIIAIFYLPIFRSISLPSWILSDLQLGWLWEDLKPMIEELPPIWMKRPVSGVKRWYSDTFLVATIWHIET